MTKIYVPDLKPLVPPQSRIYVPLADYIDSRSGSGASVEVHGSSLDEIVINGKAVQNGTPTPSEPVPIEVVEGTNVLPLSTFNTQTSKGITVTKEENGWFRVSGKSNATSATVIVLYGGTDDNLFDDGTFSVTVESEGTPFDGNKLCLQVWESSSSYHRYSEASKDTVTDISTIRRIGYSIASTSANSEVDGRFRVMVAAGETHTPYVETGAIGIVVGDKATSIPLRGNVLASLPDGTCDTLTVDSAGHCVLTKRVGGVDLGSLTWDTLTGSRFTAPLANAQNPATNSRVANAICSSYQTISTTDTGSATTGFSVSYSKNAVIYDSGHTSDTAAQFKTAMSGVMAYYQLATPTTIDLGYIDIPGIPSGGAAVSVVATITPDIEVGYTVKGSDILADLLSVSE